MVTETPNLNLRPVKAPRCLLVDEQPERAALFASVMNDRGVTVVAHVETPGAASGYLAGRPPQPANDERPAIDLIACYVGRIDASTLETIRTLTTDPALPLVVFVDSADSDDITAALGAGATFCQPLGVNSDRIVTGIASAIALQNRMSHLIEARDAAERALSERKLVDRAKAVLMESRAISEQEAFKTLQQMSMTKSKPMAEIAESIIEAKALIG